MFDETGDEEKSQGWTALIMDTNGNGQRDAYVEPNQPVDPTKDKRFGGGFYSVAPAPDGSVWGSVLGFPGAIVRLSPGKNPPETALAEVYEPPWNNPAAPVQGYSPRGADIDRNGVAWLALASGHMASFDRRKCKGPLNGPTATGQHCPEGWTLYPEPLPQFKGVTDSGSVEASYYTWVDQFDTLGLGRNVPINTGNASEGLLVLKDGAWVVLRVPYPTGTTRSGSTAASTTPRPDGRDAGCGRPSARGRRSTWRRGRARRARSSSSSCGRIRWRSDALPPPKDRVPTRAPLTGIVRPAPRWPACRRDATRSTAAGAG